MKIKRKKDSDTDIRGFNFKQMVEDKKRILKLAEEKRSAVRNHKRKKAVE